MAADDGGSIGNCPLVAGAWNAGYAVGNPCTSFGHGHWPIDGGNGWCSTYGYGLLDLGAAVGIGLGQGDLALTAIAKVHGDAVGALAASDVGSGRYGPLVAVTWYIGNRVGYV